MEQLTSHTRAGRHGCQPYFTYSRALLSCVISFIVLPTLPSPSSTVFLKFPNILGIFVLSIGRDRAYILDEGALVNRISSSSEKEGLFYGLRSRVWSESDLRSNLSSFKESPEKVEASDFFLGFLCNCFSCFTTAKITFTSIIYPAVHMWFNMSHAHHLVLELGGDYMRPVRTQTGTTSDRSPYKSLFLFTWDRFKKSPQTGLTHSGSWTDTNESDRFGSFSHVIANWFQTGLRFSF